MKSTSMFSGDRQIGPDTDSAMRIGQSSGEEEIVSLAPGPLVNAPTVEPRATRAREQKIWSREASQLEKLDPNWLDLPGVEVEGKIGEIRGRIVVQARTKFDVRPACSKCKLDESVIEWDLRDARNIKDAERNTKLVLIVLIVQRYFCKTCQKAFTPRLPFLAAGHLSRTERLSRRASSLSLERRTSTDIAGLTGLSRRTEQNIARETAKTLPTPKQVFERVTAEGKGHIVQIDNAHPSLGECTSILLDAKPFELLEQYNEAAITTFFMDLAVEGRNNVTCYVSDMAGFLLRIGRKHFPCATIVADPHHVIRRLLDRFDEFLKLFADAMLAEYICAIDDQRIVRPTRPKRGRRKKKNCLEQNLWESDNGEKKTRRPTATEIRILLHTKISGTNDAQKRALRFLLKRFPDVRAAYYYMQRVMRLYHTVEMVAYGRDAFGLRTSTAYIIDAKVASKELDKFEAKLPEHVREGLSKFLKSCRKNRDVICAFWPMGWTNADIESQNGIIRQIDRAAHGSLGFDELRRRWLYGRSFSAILGRQEGQVAGKKSGPQKKSTSELSKVPPPEPVPVMGRYGQLSLF